MATYQVGSGKAYATIQAAINAAGAANDVDALIPVDAGTYAENLDLKKHPSGWVMPVHVYAADSNNRPTITCTTGTYGITADVATHAGTAGTRQPTFTNLIFSGGTSTTALVNSSGGAPLRFYGCDFVSVMYGKTLFYQPYGGTSASYRWVIDRCWFYSGAQVILNAYGGYGIVTNNRFRWYNGAQSMIQSSGAGWLAYNNSIVSNANGGVLFMVGTAKNNAVKVTSGTAPTRVFDCTGVYDYNCTVGWAGSNVGTNGGHNIVGSDPGFAAPDSGDFSITAASPCYNAGTTIAEVTTDHRSIARPQGVSYDIGAYELIATATVTWITVSSSQSIRLNLSSSVTSDATWAQSGNFTITSDTGAAVTVTDAAASGNPGSSITLTTSEHTNGATYTVAWSGVANVTSGSTTYTGQGQNPSISSATFTAAPTMRVVFSEAMANNAALTTATNYTLTPTGGVGFNPTAVTRIDSTTVDLTVNRSLGAETGVIGIANVTDLAGNSPSSTRNITAWSSTLDGATGRLERGASFVRLVLNTPVFEDAATWITSNMTITPYLRPTYYGVDGAPATYIDIVTSDSSAQVEYAITVGGLLGIAGDTVYFNGGNLPTSAGVDAGEDPVIGYFTGPAGEAF